MGDSSLDVDRGLKDGRTHVFVAIDDNKVILIFEHAESAAMVMEEVVSTKSSCKKGFHLRFKGGDAVTDDGWNFPVLGNPVALNIHLGIILFWVIRFASVEDFKLHVFRETDEGGDGVVEGVFGGWAEFKAQS